MKLSPGKYKMRNGDTALIISPVEIKYIDALTKKEKVLHYWKGKCLDHNEPLTWNENGSWAPTHDHPYDIVSKL